MNGAVSSAELRVYKSDEQTKPLKNPGEMSSHDALNAIPPTISDQATESVHEEMYQPENTTVENVSTPEPARQDSPNFRQMRQKAEQFERESRDKEEIIQRLLRQQQTQSYTQPTSQEFDLKDDDMPEAKHINHVYQELNKVKQELNTYRQQSSTSISKANLRSQYPDYDQVMSQDNIKDLEYMRPSVARALASSGDFEGSAEAAYHMIKSLGINKHTEDTEDYEVAKKRAAANMAKPKTINAISKSNSPLSQTAVFSTELTPERKDEIWARMQKKLRTKKGY